MKAVMIAESVTLAVLLAAAVLGPTSQEDSGPQEMPPSPEKQAPGQVKRPWNYTVFPDREYPESRSPGLLQLDRGLLRTRLAAFLSVEAIKYDPDNDRRSGVEIDRASIMLEGSYDEYLPFRLEVDLLGTDTTDNLWEAWIGADLHSAARIRVGQQRFAMSSEYATRPENLPSLLYSFPAYLTGRHDIGVQVEGDAWPGKVWYQLAYGSGHGFDPDGERREGPMFMGRVVLHPLEWAGTEWLDGLFVGGAIAYYTSYDDPIIVNTPLESRIFQTQDLDGSSAVFTHIEAGWSLGPCRFWTERAVGDVRNVPIGGGATRDMDQITGLTIGGSWFISGDPVRWTRGRWRPVLGGRRRAEAAAAAEKAGERPWWKFDAVGPLEIAARFSNSDIDRNLITDGLTSFGPSSQEVRTLTLNINSFPHERLRVSAGFVNTIADQDLNAFGGTDRDRSVYLRFDLSL